MNEKQNVEPIKENGPYTLFILRPIWELDAKIDRTIIEDLRRKLKKAGDIETSLYKHTLTFSGGKIINSEFIKE